ncbi:MAG TPA: PilZ domain-containing protein [Clostridia bacterium]|nr:PilZ domain-containing protein [Clostridia bacterium]
MSIEIVNVKELYSIMQGVNLVKVKFPSEDIWRVAPILYSTEKAVEILVNSPDTAKGLKKDNTILKFQHHGFEYLVSGIVTEKNESDSVKLKFTLAQRANNQRKHFRFDTNLKVVIEKEEGKNIESTAKNISKGGAMIVTKDDIKPNSIVNIKIIFESGNQVDALSKILRKSSDKDNNYSYGIQFIRINGFSDKIIDKEISKYEKEYLKSLNILREYTNKNVICFDTKLSILSFDKEESYEIREALVKLGAENFDIFHDFKYYAGYFIDEKPKIVIFDLDEFNPEALQVIKNINNTFPEIYIVVLLPMDYLKKEDEISGIADNNILLYKPLIYDEFEREIIKYL